MKWFIFCLYLLPQAANSQVNIDYSYHAIAGCAVGLYTANTSKKPILATLIATASLGIAKELYDKSHRRRFDPKDAGATVLGGITGYAITQLLKRRQKHETCRYPRPLL